MCGARDGVNTNDLLIASVSGKIGNNFDMNCLRRKTYGQRYVGFMRGPTTDFKFPVHWTTKVNATNAKGAENTESVCG